MTVAGMVIAGLIVLLFGMDMLVGWPFYAASSIFDIGMLVCGLALLYASWNAFRDIR